MESVSKMESLLDNTSNYVKILMSCRTEEVSTWTREDLERAIKWSKHFKNVYTKLVQAKPHIREQFITKLKTRLSATLQLESTTLGYGQLLSLEFLGTKSHQYLIKSLLENPSLRRDECQHVPELAHVNEYNRSLTDDQELLQTLMKISSTITTDNDFHTIPSVSGNIIVVAIALFEEFKMIKDGTSSSFTGVDINTRIDHLLLGSKEEMEAILVCLTLNDATNEHLISSIHKDIMSRLRHQVVHSQPQSLIHSLFSLPVQSLAYMAEKSPSFLTLYLQELVTITDLSMLNCNGKFPPHSTAVKEDTNNIPIDYTPHWLALTHVNLTIREKCFTIIQEKEMIPSWKKLSLILKKEHCMT